MERYMSWRDRFYWWTVHWLPVPFRWPEWVRQRAAAAWVAAYMRWKAAGYPEDNR